MSTITKLLYTGLLCSALLACAKQAALEPQGDNTFRATAQAASVQAAKKAVDSEARETCRKSLQAPELITETTAVVDSTEPGDTQYRIIWHFNCVERGQ